MRLKVVAAAMLAAAMLAGCGGGGGGGDSPPPPPATDTTPNAFSFVARTNVAVDTPIASSAVTISGINAAAQISVTGGEYSINNGAYTSAAGTVTNGQQVAVRVTSSATASTAVTATLTVGGVSAVFSVTTAAMTSGDPLPIGSQNWPMFGHDYGNTRASKDETIGPQHVANLRVAHRVTGAGVSSTPAIVDGVVYFSDYAGWLKAVNAETGAEIWSKRLQNTMLTPSPFVSGDSVYIAGDNSNVYSVNRSTGEVRWTVKIETTPYNRIWSSPMVVGDTLLIGAASYQVFFAATPLFRGSVVALDIKTGAEKWRFSVCPPASCGGGVSVWSSVAVDPDLKLAFIGTGQAYFTPAGPYSDALLAINYETGALVWHHQITADDVYTINGGSLDRDVGAAPNLFEASINGSVRKLVGVGDKGGHYTVVDRETGQRVWQRTVDPRTPSGSPIGGVMGTPTVADGRIYFTNNTSTVGTGRFDARPGTSTAFALDAATGDIVWNLNLPAGSFSGNTVANGLLYFITWDGQLRVIDATNGTLLHSMPVGAQVGSYDAAAEGFPDGSTSGPVVSNGRIYAGYGWTWGANVAGGLAILESDSVPPPLRWAATCPAGFTPQEGLNSGFMSDGYSRSFRILPATTGTGPRPVFVSLTGTAEMEADFMRATFIDQLPAQGFTVISPVRICAANGTNSVCASGTVTTQDGRTWEPWFDGVGQSNVAQYQDAGTDVRFFERAVKCAATRYEIDQTRIFIGGISAGGTATNRALTFSSGFFAGGAPASGEWYRTDGVPISVENVGDAIIEGRAAPRPLDRSAEALQPSINIVLWGGATDKWYANGATGPLIANYNPSTKLSANYFASQSNVVTVSCTHDLNYAPPIGGHLWPRSQAMTNWVATTLAAHPKGTPREAFVLPPTPAGLTCVLGSYQDH
ncbi:outer membrane protein assembly factor BamB [Povalibacter uvarum]|uniref:Outer membrane protein assembly factor BamB n=1 Tax=Povalibacter uvarum TaxID=732238 RepID=A0A841HLJ6_9GAMM|nr:PQQ-binding-like beta-propeller repeat protein [Povalibacter uvarum]MBB6093464.1 outer membrane protein assembly factor BamB [Povalibacter uvarum]